MMTIYKVAEDDVTHAILDRLIYGIKDKSGLDIIKLPARGGKILGDLKKYNELSKTDPVVLLTDLDSFDCPSSILRKIKNKENDFLCRVAIQEAEAWLIADREGFASYLGVPLDIIPASKKIRPLRNVEDVELSFPYKPSLYMMREIVPKSNKKNIVDGLTPLDGYSKGPLYNSTLIPFIETEWNIQRASQNSYSLKRTIARLSTLSN
jgi:hypothetical protein